jgi:hypothetical protein
MMSRLTKRSLEVKFERRSSRKVVSLTGIDYSLGHHLQTTSEGFFLVDPVWLVPMVFRDQPKVHRCIGDDTDPPEGISSVYHKAELGTGVLLELIGEWLVIQKHPWIAVKSVEPVFYLPDTRDNTLQFSILA